MNIDLFVIVNNSLWKLCAVEVLGIWNRLRKSIFLTLQLLQKALVKIAASLRCHL